MNDLPLVLKILLGVLCVLLYPFIIQPCVTKLLYTLIQRGWHSGRARLAGPLFISGSLLLLPMVVPEFLQIVRLLYAMMAVTLIQKLVSYLKEHWGVGDLTGSKSDYLDFMNQYTTNYLERARPLEEGEAVPDPTRLRWLAIVKYGTVAAAMVLNVSLGIWRYTPPLVATLVKVLLVILSLHAAQDLVRAGLIRKGLRPDIVIVDLRLFWSHMYELGLLRANPITHRWLRHYVYMPLGGKNHPFRNIMACYLLSGLWHEYIFSIATMRVRGFLFAYFAINGLIVCVEGVLRGQRQRLLLRLGEGSKGFRALSVAFPIFNFFLNVCVAHLVFLGVEQVVQFH